MPAAPLANTPVRSDMAPCARGPGDVPRAVDGDADRLAHRAGRTLPYSLFMLAHGVHQPCSQSGAVGPFPQAAGAASALNGFLMKLAAFGVGGWVGWRLDATVFAPTNHVWFWSAVIAVTAWTLVQRHGEPHRL